MKTYEHLKQAARIEATVSVTVLRTDGGTQYRSRTEEDTVEQYKLSIKDGAKFPPIDTVFDGQHHWVYDGFHRLAAFSLLGKPTIAVRYIDGELADAQLLALTVNAQHGLPRDLATKRKICLAAISNPLLENCSVYELAKITGLSAPYIKGMQNPDVKIRQQQARDRSAIKKIKQEVTNPITNCSDQEIMVLTTVTDQLVTSPTTSQTSSEKTTPANLDMGPSEDELRANELAQQADQDMLYKLLEADEPLAVAHEEIKRLNHQNGLLEVRLHGLMHERNAAVKQAKDEQRRCEKLERQLRAYKTPKPEIKINSEVRNRKDLADSFALSNGIKNA